MEFRMWNYHFDGCYDNPVYLQNEQGIYIVWCRCGIYWTVLDVGESFNVKQSLAEKAGSGHWEHECSGTIMFSALYMPACTRESRQRTLSIIRNHANNLMTA